VKQVGGRKIKIPPEKRFHLREFFIMTKTREWREIEGEIPRCEIVIPARAT
jgi:hypothetical protein